MADNGNSAVQDDGAFGIEDLTLDLPAVVGAFSQRLHEAGMPVTPSQTQQYALSLTLTKPVSRRRLYWTTRAIFVTGFIQLPTFDRVFREVFGSTAKSDAEEDAEVELEPAPPKDETENDEAEEDPEDLPDSGEGAADLKASEGSGEEDEDAEEQEIPILSASEEEELSQKHFSALALHELAALYRLMVRLDLATPVRRTRRRKRGRHGEHMDMRRTLRNSLKTGGDPIKLARRRRRVQKRRLVLLCDISGSMEPYARAYLQFLHCARASGPDHEAFVFATRLTRLTKQLAGRNPNRAIRRATEAVDDWSSGTRIGDALKAFNDRYGRRGMARGSVIVILSDGWERGDPEMVVARDGAPRAPRLPHRLGQPARQRAGLSAQGRRPRRRAAVLQRARQRTQPQRARRGRRRDRRRARRRRARQELEAAVAGRRGGGAELGRRGIGLGRRRDAQRLEADEGQDGARPQLVGRQRRRLRDGLLMAPLAHIAGIPLEETLAMAAPVLGATCAALMATLRNRGRRPWKQPRSKP